MATVASASPRFAVRGQVAVRTLSRRVEESENLSVSYVVRTEWGDIDGFDRALTGQGNVGELWTGSSVGPTVNGRLGVDVPAPRDRVVTTYAPRSYWATLRGNQIEGRRGLYGMAGAVSAAAPVVTGIIALMLEVDPTLDAVSVRRILQRTARADAFTGRTPNALWGYGKVDAFEALVAASPDDDGDGLPTRYETDRGLDPKDPADAEEDPDQDGLTNLREFHALTDPFRPTPTETASMMVKNSRMASTR